MGEKNQTFIYVYKQIYIHIYTHKYSEDDWIAIDRTRKKMLKVAESSPIKTYDPYPLETTVIQISIK